MQRTCRLGEGEGPSRWRSSPGTSTQFAPGSPGLPRCSPAASPTWYACRRSRSARRISCRRVRRPRLCLCGAWSGGPQRSRHAGPRRAGRCGPWFRPDPAPGQARVLSATVAGLRVMSVYAVNGQAVGTPDYALELRWLSAFTSWLGATQRPGDPAADLTSTSRRRPRCVRSGRPARAVPVQRARARAPHRTAELGLTDLTRAQPRPRARALHVLGLPAGAFHRGWGLRIDLALGTAPVAARCTAAAVDRDERKPTAGEGKPSDHAPLIITLAPVKLHRRTPSRSAPGFDPDGLPDPLYPTLSRLCGPA